MEQSKPDTKNLRSRPKGDCPEGAEWIQVTNPLAPDKDHQPWTIGNYVQNPAEMTIDEVHQAPVTRCTNWQVAELEGDSVAMRSLFENKWTISRSGKVCFTGSMISRHCFVGGQAL